MAFLHKAYLEAQLDPISSREPWERFAEHNALIDRHVRLVVDGEDGDMPILRFLLPGGNDLPLNIEISRLLYQLDRDAYIEALNAARNISISATYPLEEQGE